MHKSTLTRIVIALGLTMLAAVSMIIMGIILFEDLFESGITNTNVFGGTQFNFSTYSFHDLTPFGLLFNRIFFVGVTIKDMFVTIFLLYFFITRLKRLSKMQEKNAKETFEQLNQLIEAEKQSKMKMSQKRSSISIQSISRQSRRFSKQLQLRGHDHKSQSSLGVIVDSPKEEEAIANGDDHDTRPVNINHDQDNDHDHDISSASPGGVSINVAEIEADNNNNDDTNPSGINRNISNTTATSPSGGKGMEDAQSPSHLSAQWKFSNWHSTHISMPSGSMNDINSINSVTGAGDNGNINSNTNYEQSASRASVNIELGSRNVSGTHGNQNSVEISVGSVQSPSGTGTSRVRADTFSRHKASKLAQIERVYSLRRLGVKVMILTMISIGTTWIYSFMIAINTWWTFVQFIDVIINVFACWLLFSTSDWMWKICVKICYYPMCCCLCCKYVKHNYWNKYVDQLTQNIMH